MKKEVEKSNGKKWIIIFIVTGLIVIACVALPRLIMSVGMETTKPYDSVETYEDLKELVDNTMSNEAYWPDLSRYDFIYKDGYIYYSYNGSKREYSGYSLDLALDREQNNSKLSFFSTKCNYAIYRDTEENPFIQLQDDLTYQGVIIQEDVLDVSQSYQYFQEEAPGAIPNGGGVYYIMQLFDFNGCRYEVGGHVLISNDISDPDAHLAAAKEELFALSKSIIDQG